MRSIKEFQRKTRCKEILNLYYHSLCFNNIQLNVKVNEDLFWGLFVESQCSFFKVPTPVVALDFAFEAHPDHLFELNQQRLPFGCHAWQRYQPDFWVKTLGPQWFSRLETKLLIDQSSTRNQACSQRPLHVMMYDTIQ